MASANVHTVEARASGWPDGPWSEGMGDIVGLQSHARALKIVATTTSRQTVLHEMLRFSGAKTGWSVQDGRRRSVNLPFRLKVEPLAHGFARSEVRAGALGHCYDGARLRVAAAAG